MIVITRRVLHIKPREIVGLSEAIILHQVAALPLRKKEAMLEVCLVTTRETGRWTVPKGWPMKGIKDFLAAKIEAEQEAGVTGNPDKKPFGTSSHSQRGDDVQRLLDEGVGADLGARWNAIVAASVALTSTPIAFDATHVAALRDVGLDDTEISDVIHGAAFFNWANRLMLSIGEPTPANAA
jgi:8-oxo-dGTP pyrophosphatase MutT (NUDIX family)